jgi:hypothetical protein
VAEARKATPQSFSEATPSPGSSPDHTDRVRGKFVLVLMDRKTSRALAFPKALRGRIADFVVAG